MWDRQRKTVAHLPSFPPNLSKDAVLQFPFVSYVFRKQKCPKRHSGQTLVFFSVKACENKKPRKMWVLGRDLFCYERKARAPRLLAKLSSLNIPRFNFSRWISSTDKPFFLPNCLSGRSHLSITYVSHSQPLAGLETLEVDRAQEKIIMSQKWTDALSKVSKCVWDNCGLVYYRGGNRER
jgi:hypothetical protein